MLKRFSFPYSFLLLLLFIAHFFFLSNAESHCTISQSRPLLGKIQRRKYDLVDLWGSKRLLGDAQKNENVSLVLAQERTTRKDPLDKFKIYRGGWNITESHYWAVSF
ncbi:putative transmembrane protein [Helianthus anomalus]